MRLDALGGAIAAILLTAQVPAAVGPDEETKRRAFKLGYALNGESMVRAPQLGSIDVSGLLAVPDASLIQSAPPAEPQNVAPSKIK